MGERQAVSVLLKKSVLVRVTNSETRCAVVDGGSSWSGFGKGESMSFENDQVRFDLPEKAG